MIRSHLMVGSLRQSWFSNIRGDLLAGAGHGDAGADQYGGDAEH